MKTKLNSIFKALLCIIACPLSSKRKLYTMGNRQAFCCTNCGRHWDKVIDLSDPESH